jgi:hypothetical protein
MVVVVVVGIRCCKTTQFPKVNQVVVNFAASCLL